MAPFAPLVLVKGVKERIESITLQGDILYFGTSTGSLITHSIERNDEGYKATPLETKVNFTRRSIDQLGYIRDVNSLVVLSDGTVSLHPLPKLGPATPLLQAKGALSFAVRASVQLIPPEEGTASTSAAGSAPEGIPTVVSQLVVGCRKKVVIYSWKDGEPQGPKELALPHSPRAIAFCNPQMLVLAYTATEHAIIYLNTMSVAELNLPSPAQASAGLGMGKVGMGAFSGLGGYMPAALGGKVAKPMVMELNDGETLITKESASLFVGSDGKPSRSISIEWNSPPEDVAFIKPYVLAILPPASPSLALTTSHNHVSSPRLQVRSSLSLANVQTLPFPFNEATTPIPPSTLRLLTSSPGGKSPACVVATPTDRNAAASEGSTVWFLTMQSWGQQVDELVDAGEYADALALLDTIDRAMLEDKDRRVSFIRGLHAVSLFANGHYDDAINIFIELDINPAKVVALYPEAVAGRLSKPPEEWVVLFGGKPKLLSDSVDDVGSSAAEKAQESVETETAGDPGAAPRPPSPQSTLGSQFRSSVHSVGGGATGVVDKSEAQLFSRSVETLLRYLSDRRPKLSGALASHYITPAKSFELPFLSENSVEDLLNLPDAPLSALVPDQLLRFAQIVDTALFKSYLIVRPSLVGSLCRVDNWCEVSEVEEVLRERKKFSELIDLYRGKKMHERALSLLHDLSLEETDLEDKLDPAVRYLQKLGPEYLSLVFDSSRWVIEEDHKFGLKIFTTEEVQLPRDEVADFLMSVSPALCIGFLEWLIDEIGEKDSSFHDRLAELYLSESQNAHQTDGRTEAYTKLLTFIRTSDSYRPNRLFGSLPPNSLFEARAIVLGRMEKHEAALEIYVHRLHDYTVAEEYCKNVYQGQPEARGIFLVLLGIYLRSNTAIRPTSPAPSIPSATQFGPLLIPAIELISRHSPRMDPVKVLELLPPLVAAADVRGFLFEALNTAKIQTKVAREIWKAKHHQAGETLVDLHSRRVRVTDSRICPQCHKRLGNSVIAVHAPRGEVTHYQCREAFAAQKLRDSGRLL